MFGVNYSNSFNNSMDATNIQASANNAHSNTTQLPITFSNNKVNLNGAEDLVRRAYKVSNLILEVNSPALNTSKSPIILQGANRIVQAYLESSPTSKASSFKPFSLHNIESRFISDIDSAIASSAYKLSLTGKTLSSNSNSELRSVLNHSINENLSVAKQNR